MLNRERRNALEKTLRTLFLQRVQDRSTHPFLIDAQHGMSLTYAETLEAVQRRIGRLYLENILPQERLIIIDEQRWETVLWFIACLMCGIVCVILPADISQRRLKQIVQDCEPVATIDHNEQHLPLYQESRLFRSRIADDVLCEERVALPQILETDPAFFVYTSGSTGQPKAVVYPHQAVLAVTEAINHYLANSRVDRIGHQLSLVYVYGLFQLFLCIQAGASLIFLPKMLSPVELLQHIRTQRITAFPALRPTLMLLARLKPEDCQIDDLRYITASGDHIPPATITAIIHNFPTTRFFSMYGLSECARALYMPPERLARKPASVGQPIPGTRAFLRDENGAAVLSGEIAELVIEGPHIMSGYWKASEETATTFRTGSYGQRQLYTGDLFYQDDEGDFYFVGRKDDLVKRGGIRLSPREVEIALLAADPLLNDCIVYSRSDEALGQALHAEVVVSDSAHTVNAIFQACRTHIDPHLIPTTITIVEALSTTATGKYRRRRE